MARKTISKSDEAQAVALAAFALSVNTLRFLKEKGALDQDDVNSVLGGVLLALEKDDLVSEPAAHHARALLAGVASDLGVPLKKPN